MEGSELDNLDSELVMSFYDQYQADELCKVYGDIADKFVDPPPPLSPTTSINSAGVISPSHLTQQPGQVLNLPDLLVGLDGLQKIEPVIGGHSPTLPGTGCDLMSGPSTCSSSPVTLPSPPPLLQQQQQLQHQPSSSSHFDNLRVCNSDIRQSLLFDNFRQSTDSLLEGLGLLPSQTQSPASVKNEPLLVDPLELPPPPQLQQQPQQQLQTNLHHQYFGLENLELEITPFELNLKQEPGLTVTSIANLPNLDILTKAESSVCVDPLIAQQCTLLPPEFISDQGILLPGLRSGLVATVDDITDHPLSEAAAQSVLNVDNFKEEEECLEKPVEVEANPSYKRCHLCVRIFSTKANLSSHIRHVHLGETKQSRVKSIPCPHCHKMFSRKGHMTEHVRTVHEGKKRIYKEVNCQHCGKTFRRKWGLNIHISSAHADLVSSLL